MINLEENWSKIKKELRSTDRDGIEPLISYLDTTDFKIAPASSRYHLSIPSGLMEHSLNVLKYARILTKELPLEIEDVSLILSSLLHDLCKVNFYKIGQVWDKEYKEKFNQWRKIDCYIIEDEIPLGHGEKSLMIASRYIKLLPDEMTAIRWHMLNWDVSPMQTKTMQEATKKYPLVKLIAIADQTATFYEEMYDEEYRKTTTTTPINKDTAPLNDLPF